MNLSCNEIIEVLCLLIINQPAEFLLETKGQRKIGYNHHHPVWDELSMNTHVSLVRNHKENSGSN